MNWALLLTLYGTARSPANPLLKALSNSFSHLLCTAEEQIGYRLFETGAPQLLEEQVPAPFSYYLLSDASPAEQLVPTKGQSLFSYVVGSLNTKEMQKRLLSLGRSEGVAKNYTELVASQVLHGLTGKYSMVTAHLGPVPSFLLASNKLDLRVWLLSYDGVYYLLASNTVDLAHRIESSVLKLTDSEQESFFQQDLEVPGSVVLAVRPLYLITKFRQRMSRYDSSQRKLLICTYIRRYIQRQCLTLA